MEEIRAAPLLLPQLPLWQRDVGLDGGVGRHHEHLPIQVRRDVGVRQFADGGANLSSRAVGRAQGMHMYAGMRELRVFMVYNYLFTEGRFNGSTLNGMG